MNRLEQLKTIPIKAFTKEDFDILDEENITNGVGNKCLPDWLRHILTQLFFYLNWEFHDARYWQIEDLPEKEREIERKKADIGILKYTWLSPVKYMTEYQTSGIILKDLGSFILMVIKVILSILVMPIGVLAYIAVRFLGKNSFNK